MTYSVSGGSRRIDFEGESDMDTVFAPTSHLYFNLDGSESVLDTELMINAGGVLEVDGALIPTGKILPAEGRFDFSGMRKIQEDYDNCFPLASKAACRIRAGGLSMALETDFPAVQIYTGAFLARLSERTGGLPSSRSFIPTAPITRSFPPRF